MAHPLEVREDVLFIRIQGSFDDAMMAEVLHLVETQILSKHPYYYALIDARQMTSFPAAARYRASKWPLLHRNGGNAMIGAGMIARTAMTMVARAVTLFRKIPILMTAFPTEEEALQWIAQRRKELQLAVKSPLAS